jgi:hypothetical protein
MESTRPNSFKRRRTRLRRPLSEGLDKRLASYAAAASAAGVGLLFSADPASARIVYTPVYTEVEVFPGSPFPLDLNHDGITDFKFGTIPGAYGGGLALSAAQPGNAILGKTQGVLSNYGAPFTCQVASALPAGHRIGPSGRFGAYRTLSAGELYLPMFGPNFEVGCGYFSLFGQQPHFLGVEFMAQGQKHFGWVRLNNIHLPGAFIRFLTGYAYETDPDTPIRAGDTGPIADARVPEMHSAPPAVATLRPATLGLLALGSRGLDIWRKEQ